MKKATIITTVALLIAAGAYLAFAAEQTNTMMGRGMRSRAMMDSNDMMTRRGMMGQGMAGQQGMMGQQGVMGQGMMRGFSMVATPDGGVILLAGNKLMKYDKDLNLVKEVEIKIDWESWNKAMMEHRKMMMGGQSE